MMLRRKTSGSEVRQRWETLIGRKRPRSDDVAHPPRTINENEDDPFDCSNLAVLPSKEMVESVLVHQLEAWRSLERRKVTKEMDVGTPKPKGWLVSRVRLPRNFDYESKRSEPPPEDGTGDKVVSLEDATKQISYEHELWKIFNDTPTLQELETERLVGAKCTQMREAVEYMETNIQQAPGLQSHANVRLRMKDRHYLPDPPLSNPLVTTVRLEVWRRNLKNQPSMAAHRLELEFLASQTLEDVHTAIVELSEDDFWEETEVGQATRSKDRSGFFFIEDTFYKSAGNVDYIQPIMNWLEGEEDDKEKVQSMRRVYLGIPIDCEIHVKAMSDTRLDVITWRLGTRYVHVHHGDVETAIFLSDLQYGPGHPTSYPIIHDDWSPSYRAAFCDACGKDKPGTIATQGGNPLTDGTPRVLCSVCFDALFWDQSNIPHAKFSIWRNQFELSTGLEPPDVNF